jgi:ABC-type Na+ efflux pump permease subunit
MTELSVIWIDADDQRRTVDAEKGDVIVVRNISLWNSLILGWVVIAYSFLPTRHNYWMIEQNHAPAKSLEAIQPSCRYITRALICLRVVYVRSSILTRWLIYVHPYLVFSFFLYALLGATLLLAVA